MFVSNRARAFWPRTSPSTIRTCPTGPDDLGSVVVDVFRLDDGPIVEHWDVATPLTAEAAASGRPLV
jgi:predicted SnoaL-like aldol condensation-catalyzing enzyme